MAQDKDQKNAKNQKSLSKNTDKVADKDPVTTTTKNKEQESKKQQKKDTTKTTKDSAKETENINGEPTSDETPPEEANENGRGAIFYVLFGLGGTIAICFILFIVAVIIGLISGSSEDAASFVAIIRDLFIILLAMQGILISVALVIMILQLATLLNVLQNEIAPMVDNLQQTTSTIRGTAEFMSKHVTQPVIKGSGYLSAAWQMVREVSGIRQAVRGNGKNKDIQGELTSDDDLPQTLLDNDNDAQTAK